MLPKYKDKLLVLMWMGVGSAVLSSIFSVFIISYVVSIKKKISRLSIR
ncbi:hypothetical protein [Bacillus sp. ISL-45]|nr:hypothetical protein [Bacillus sp. ISL-45]MBT2661927.1 hypothetical protein [Bacillus sp. ISL-45]